jgi:hypothetical protein
MLHCSTSPYFSKRRVTSSSLSEGWMPVTNRLEPELRLSSSSSLRAGGGPLGACQCVVPSTGAGRYIPTIAAAVTAVGGGAAGTRAVVATVTTRRPAAIALVAARLVYTPVSICDSITQAGDKPS